MKNPAQHHRLLGAQADALATRIVLDELRAGRLAIALELLEEHLDTAVLTLHTLAREADPSSREQSGETLRVVRDYRRRHPRKSEAVIAEAADTLETQKRVQAILDETI